VTDDDVTEDATNAARSPLPKSVTEAMMANAATIMTRPVALRMGRKRRPGALVPGTR